jgi:hypothetical protein
VTLRRSIVALIVVTGTIGTGQVLTPFEISDRRLQQLQKRHLQTLMTIGAEIEAHKFPFPFYFSRVLDVDLSQMQRSDQRSIRFDIYNGQTVLEITGNYYAAYSADRMDSYARLKETFERVLLPILQAEAAHFPDNSEFSAFAVEVSHHVRQTIMGVSSERPENVTLIIPVPVAQKLVEAKTDDQTRAAISDAQVFLDGEPQRLWLGEGDPSDKGEGKEARQLAIKKHSREITDTGSRSTDINGSPTPIQTPPTTEALAALQAHYQETIDRMLKALDGQAHFLSYAPPALISFRQSVYLQLSFRSSVEAGPGSSRYKLAALAFDDHVSHLIRPVLQYFPENVDFDGVSFSSIVEPSDGSHTEAVEFFLPFPMMRCFEDYRCTGQQLLDTGAIVINGERSTLDLQIAEGND